MMLFPSKKSPLLAFRRLSSTSAVLAENTAVIKLPEYVKKHVERMKNREEKYRLDVQRKVLYRGNTSMPVISCNKKEYNFYLGQIYNENYPIPLISKYWMKTRTVGEKFTINAWGPNPSLPTKIETTPVVTELILEDSMSHFITEFKQMNLHEDIMKGLEVLNYKYPTPIQALTVPKVLKHNHTLCVAETGSGKTMSYAIPIINNLMQWNREIKRFAKSPLALVVVPGRELAEQIALNIHKLGSSCGVNVKVLLPGGTSYPFLKADDSVPTDILVGTFGIINKLVSGRVINLAQLQHLVLDEADTILDDSFRADLEHLMSRIMIQESCSGSGEKPAGAQLVLASSTMSRYADAFLRDFLFDEVSYERAISPFMHKVLSHVPQKFIRVSRENKASTFLELVKADAKKKKSIMVFCNRSPACNWMSHILEQNDVRHVKFHAALSHEERSEALERFTSGDVDVMCCTDLASRGLDTQGVKHVINFEFPNNVSDYILRVGRVGRVGTNRGHVTSLVCEKSQVYVVQDVETAVRKSARMQNVDANIKKRVEKLIRDSQTG